MSAGNDILRGRTALVTGGTSGIGWGIARLLAGRGTRLVINGSREELLQERRKELIENYGADCRIVQADISTEEGVNSLIEKTRHIGIDILVNNAGSISYGCFWELDWDIESRRIYLDAVAPARLAHAVLPAMLERGFGRILNIASVAGLMPGPYFATYNASKAFLVSFSESLTEELRGTPVTCGCLLPGTTRTNLWNAERLREKVDITERRFVEPDTVAAVAVRMLETGAAFEIVGMSNKVKQFILGRLVPRSVARKVLGIHCLSPLVFQPGVREGDYTPDTSIFTLRRTGGGGKVESIGMAELLPDNICPYLAHSLVPYIMTLRGGGVFPWMGAVASTAVDVQCPNPAGAVVTRVKANGGRFDIEVIEVRGHCPKGHKAGGKFQWPPESSIPPADLNVVLSWMLQLHSKAGPERTPAIQSPTGKAAYQIGRAEGRGVIAETACPPASPFELSLGYFKHRCRYHKWPRREYYDESSWIPRGMCPELFHAAYPFCLAMIYGGMPEAPREVVCPQSGEVRVRITIEARKTILFRRAAMRTLQVTGLNAEIPLHRCFLEVVAASANCPMGMKLQAVFEFNMGGAPELCPAMFHNAYPVLATRMRGAAFPWPELLGKRGIVQCPDNASNITLTYRGKSGDD